MCSWRHGRRATSCSSTATRRPSRGRVTSFSPVTSSSPTAIATKVCSIARTGRRQWARRPSSTSTARKPSYGRRELMGDDVRVVVVLRDPAERAFSGYAHLVRDGRETASSFAEALECEDERVASGWEYIWHHRRLGSYSRQLECLFDVIGRDRVLVLRHEDLADNPLGTCAAHVRLPRCRQHVPAAARSFQQPRRPPRSQTLVRLLHRTRPLPARSPARWCRARSASAAATASCAGTCVRSTIPTTAGISCGRPWPRTYGPPPASPGSTSTPGSRPAARRCRRARGTRWPPRPRPAVS